MAIKLIHQHFDRLDYASHREFRKSVERHLKAVLLSRSVTNNHTGVTIKFNGVGIEKMVSSIGDIKVFALCNLQPILRHGILQEQVIDRGNRPDIISFLRFITKVEINGVEYEVWSYVRQRANGYFLYSINIDVQKTP